MDYVIGTGEAHSVREFCDAAFNTVDLDYRDYVYEDPAFYRPAEVETLLADPTRLKAATGWTPEFTFEEMVEMMVRAER